MYHGQSKGERKKHAKYPKNTHIQQNQGEICQVGGNNTFSETGGKCIVFSENRGGNYKCKVN